jgi:hypothetical protein
METTFIKTPLGPAKISGDDYGIASIPILKEGDSRETLGQATHITTIRTKESSDATSSLFLR